MGWTRIAESTVSGAEREAAEKRFAHDKLSPWCGAVAFDYERLKEAYQALCGAINTLKGCKRQLDRYSQVIPAPRLEDSPERALEEARREWKQEDEG